jgi:hypothetical protein
MADEQKGLLARLMTETWPARAGRGILDALMLPGQVAGGILNVQPERPGYWSDTDEARSQLTNQTMMNRASDLGGLMLLGASGAPAVPNSVGMGVRTVPQTNYLEPLSKYTKNVYREASPEGALYDLPGSTMQGGLYAGSPARQFYADTPDMALGQGTNRGVRVGYDAGAFQGQINQSKPGWQPAFENGMGEYIASPVKGADVRGAVNSLSIDKEMLAAAPRSVQSNYRFVQDKLRQSGWELTDSGKSFDWVKK